jgi:hypothetical protein
MRGRLACLVLAAGCGGERVAECDALVATLERVSACGRIDATQRAQIEQTVRTVKEALDRLEDVGPDRAPADLLNDAKRTCAKQDAEIRQLYGKLAPDCLR